MSKEINKLYGESELDIYVITSCGQGGVFTENEYMKIFLLASVSWADRMQKMFCSSI